MNKILLVPTPTPVISESSDCSTPTFVEFVVDQEGVLILSYEKPECVSFYDRISYLVFCRRKNERPYSILISATNYVNNDIGFKNESEILTNDIVRGPITVKLDKAVIGNPGNTIIVANPFSGMPTLPVQHVLHFRDFILLAQVVSTNDQMRQLMFEGISLPYIVDELLKKIHPIEIRETARKIRTV